jgi:hypothetical protein
MRTSLISRCIAAVSAVLMWVPTPATASIVDSHGPIQGLRVEGNMGFIGLTQVMSGRSTCGTRVWVDLNTFSGRTAYATAMMAFNSQRFVVIRAFEESQRVFGECQMHDIYVPQSQ